MKKTILFSLAAVLIMACGSQSNKTEGSTDSLAVGVDSTIAEAKAVAETSVAEEPVVKEPVLNVDLLGKWSNNNDPVIDIKLSDKYGSYSGNGSYGSNKGYGYLEAANEYFEYDFCLLFTALTPDGDKIRVKYDKYESYYDGEIGDDDSEFECVTKNIGSGELTLVPVGTGKLKIESNEKRIRNTILFKSK